MAEHKMLSAEEMLAKIFEYMNQLTQETDFSSTIMILTELTRCILMRTQIFQILTVALEFLKTQAFTL